MGGRPSRLRRSKARVGALMELATWMATHFKLAQRPKIHTATESEVVYAHILGMLHDESLEQRELESVPAGPINIPDSVHSAAFKAVEDLVLRMEPAENGSEGLRVVTRAALDAAFEQWFLLERGNDGNSVIAGSGVGDRCRERV